MFKSLFCCFTPTHRQHRKSTTHSKNGTTGAGPLQNTTNINQATTTTTAIMNANQTTTTTNTNFHSINNNNNNNTHLVTLNNNNNNSKHDINNNNNLNLNANSNNLNDPYKNIIASINNTNTSNSNNSSNLNYLNAANNLEHNNDYLQQNIPVSFFSIIIFFFRDKHACRSKNGRITVYAKQNFQYVAI
jgi:hypothetical protein